MVSFDFMATLKSEKTKLTAGTLQEEISVALKMKYK